MLILTTVLFQLNLTPTRTLEITCKLPNATYHCLLHKAHQPARDSSPSAFPELARPTKDLAHRRNGRNGRHDPQPTLTTTTTADTRLRSAQAAETAAQTEPVVTRRASSATAPCCDPAVGAAGAARVNPTLIQMFTIPSILQRHNDAGPYPCYAGEYVCGFDNLTPIQKFTIPLILQRHNAIGIAQTWSLDKVTTKPLILIVVPPVKGTMGAVGAAGAAGAVGAAEPLILIVAPTRELAIQIPNEAREFCYRTMLRPSVIYGGILILPHPSMPLIYGVYAPSMITDPNAFKAFGEVVSRVKQLSGTVETSTSLYSTISDAQTEEAMNALEILTDVSKAGDEFAKQVRQTLDKFLKQIFDGSYLSTRRLYPMIADGTWLDAPKVSIFDFHKNIEPIMNAMLINKAWTTGANGNAIVILVRRVM
ncbi:hypothetical protein LRP88_00163 [Fusarium phalaenopsidis]